MGMFHAVGDPAAEEALMSLLAVGGFPTAEAVAAAVKSVRGFWALLLDGPAGQLAAVDHVRSLPLFYAQASDGPIIGDDARGVAQAAGLHAFDSIAVEDLALSGYATGPRTLLAGLSQLVAGEVVVWPAGGQAARARHHAYKPSEEAVAPVSTQALGMALDVAIDRLLIKAAGRPIGVPLSGGLDSRFVLAKMVERGHKPLFSFSYGPKNNSDAEIARLVAERLGVPWQFVATSGSQIRSFFESQARRDYWRFADGLASVPNMQDVLPLAVLLQADAMPPDSVIVNGQTGDFISGAHIPRKLVDAVNVKPAELFDALIDKHFSLWRSQLSAERRRTIRARIAAALGLDQDGPAMTPTAAASHYERYEHAERQSKFVVNGQRSYEWHGLDWHLPLWDRDVVDLFARAPLADRAHQSLYRRYLYEWNYKGVFSDINRKVTAWPRVTSALLAPVAVALRLAVGRQRRDQLFRYVNYFDRFGDHYKAFGFKEFACNVQDARNPAALYVRTWLRENGVAF